MIWCCINKLGLNWIEICASDLCLRQCLSCDITPPPQVRVHAVHLAHSPHQYVVTSSSSSRLLDATPSSYTHTHKDVYIKTSQQWSAGCFSNSNNDVNREAAELDLPTISHKPNLFSLQIKSNERRCYLYLSL